MDIFQQHSFSKEFENFLCKCLSYDPKNRPTIKTLLNHEFM